jgi:uncharacterized membrane protein YphA (DoxX/SURF4 family)
MRTAGRLLLAASLIGLGLVALISGEFLGLWQPLPAPFSSYRVLADVSGIMLCAGGAGLVADRTQQVAALNVALYLAAWILLLHAPLVVMAPRDARHWVYLGEILAIVCGALALYAPRSAKWWVAIRVGYALSLFTFGASHFADLPLMSSVVPSYLPAPLAIAAVTGAAHLAAGAALLLNLLPRPAAVLEATMLSGFELLVNLPGVMAAPSEPGAWTTLLFEGALVACAWIVAGTIRKHAGSETR